VSPEHEAGIVAQLAVRAAWKDVSAVPQEFAHAVEFTSIAPPLKEPIDRFKELVPEVARGVPLP